MGILLDGRDGLTKDFTTAKNTSLILRHMLACCSLLYVLVP